MPTIEQAPVRWGIIGCGSVTEVKSGPGFQLATGSELVAVMRRNGELAADYAQRHNVPRWYDDAQQLIDDNEVNAVYIATPPGSHCELALQVAAAGKPAYVEKPMARHFTECRRMNEAFASAGLPLFVAYYRRGLPRFRTARQLIEEGRLGTITSVSYRMTQTVRERDAKHLPWRLEAENAGAGLFLDLGSHTLDILDFLLGPLQNVAGHAVNLANDHAVEDALSMSFQTSGGAVGTASWNFAASCYEDTIVIDGTRGRLTMTTFGTEELRLQTAGGESTFDGMNPPHVQAPLIQTIVDDLLGKGTCPSTGTSAARTSQVMDTVLASYYGGRDDEFWNRPQNWPGRRI
jgi:predicted dehydrogenase